MTSYVGLELETLISAEERGYQGVRRLPRVIGVRMPACRIPPGEMGNSTPNKQHSRAACLGCTAKARKNDSSKRTQVKTGGSLCSYCNEELRAYPFDVMSWLRT